MRTRIDRDVVTAVATIVAAVAADHGLGDMGDRVGIDTELAGDLGMDDVDLVTVLFRLEDRFGILLPDDRIDARSTVGEIAACVAEQLAQQSRSPTPRPYARFKPPRSSGAGFAGAAARA